MTIQRIDNDAKSMHGWQARVPLDEWRNGRRLYRSRYYADKRWGGKRAALENARDAERLMAAGWVPA